MKRQIAFGLLMFAAMSARAQFSSDEVPQGRVTSLRQQVNDDLDRARLRLGILRLRPVAAIRDLGFETDIGSSESAEWRSTLAGGVQFIAPFTGKVFLRGGAIPQYTWYQRSVARRTWGGDYNGSLLFLFNRMSVVAGAGELSAFRTVSPEIDRTTFSKRRIVFGEANVDVMRRIALVFGGLSERQTFEEDAVLNARLARKQDEIRAGVRYRVGAYLSTWLLAERTKTTFENVPDGDNTGNATILSAQYARPRTFANVTVGHRVVTGNSARFRKFSNVTGSYMISHLVRSRFNVDLHGRQKSFTYAVFSDNPYFSSTRHGVGLSVPVGRRISTRVFADLGFDDYPVPVLVGSNLVTRKDDARLLGGSLIVRLFKNVSLKATATDTTYESNIPGFDRSLFRLQTLVSFSGELFE